MSGKSNVKSLWSNERLCENKYKLTKPRRAIIDTLSKRCGHFSAEDIHMKILRTYPTIGLASIYRNLELLVRIGLILKYDFGDGKARYELTQAPDEIHHHHLICKNCNKVIDYSQSIDDERRFVKRREKNLSRKYGFKIERYFIDFFGMCRECKGKV